MEENLKWMLKIGIILSPVAIFSMITGCWFALWSVIGIALLGLGMIFILSL